LICVIVIDILTFIPSFLSHGADRPGYIGIQATQMTFVNVLDADFISKTKKQVVEYLELGMPVVLIVMLPGSLQDQQVPTPGYQSGYLSCGLLLFLPRDLDFVTALPKERWMYNPFVFQELRDVNSSNAILCKRTVLWRNAVTGVFDVGHFERGRRYICSMILYEYKQSMLLYSKDTLVALSPIFKIREYHYLQWFRGILESLEDIHYELRLWRQGDMEVLLGMNKCVLEFKGYTYTLNQFCCRRAGGKPYNPNVVDVLAVVAMDVMVVVRCVLFPMRTNDGKENLLQWMSRSHSIHHTVCSDILIPGDTFVIEANDPINLVAFRETLHRWTLFPNVDDWALSQAEIDIIQQEKQNL